MSNYLILFLFFLLPFVVYPLGPSIFEVAKVIVAEVLIELLFIYEVILKRSINFKKINPILLVGVGGLALLSLSQTIFSKDTTSLFGNAFRLQGVVLFLHLLVFSLLSSQVKLKKIPYYIPLLSLSMLFLSIFYFGLNGANRAIGPLGEPNALAAASLILFPFIFFASSKKAVKVLGFILTGVLIFLTGSRSGVIGYGIEILFILLSSKISIFKALLISLVLIILTLFLPILIPFDSTSNDSSYKEDRGLIWQTAFQAGLQKPIFGWGFGATQSALKQEATQLQNGVRFLVVDSSHNFLLDYWIEGGLVGLSLILLLLTNTFINLIRRKQLLELTILLGIMTAMFFNPTSVVVLIAFFYILGSSSHQS